MFLRKVYNHSKWMFVVMICFIIGQALINYNHGAVATPLYNYGMYSEAFKVKPAYDVIIVEVNGSPLRGQDFSIQQWDKIYLPIRYYLSADSNNNQMIAIRNRMYTHLHLNSLKEKNQQFINPPLSPQQFMSWYSNYLEQVVGDPIKTLTIKEAYYSTTNIKLTPILSDSFKLILPAWNSANNSGAK